MAAPDLLELYRWAVQDPETHATVLDIMHRAGRPAHPALVLREDFAGTSADSVAWIALGGDAPRRAVAIDLDAAALRWAGDRAALLLGPRAAAIEFACRDALGTVPPEAPEADILSVLNFSIQYLSDPATLSAYLDVARRSLAPGGILVANLFGGRGARLPSIDRRRVEPAPRLPAERPIAPFDYVWEVRSWDPATRVADCRIHFEVADAASPGGRRRIDDAFRYDFRLWEPREVMEAAARAGFGAVEFWRHTYDPSKGAAGVFLGAVDPGAVAELSTWTGYIVARRGSA